jgi:large subunit ribosomal protein L29
MRLGQTEGVKKLRGLKKDIARLKTIERERELGLNAALHHAAPAAPAKAKKAAPKKTATKSTATKKKTAKKEAR